MSSSNYESIVYPLIINESNLVENTSGSTYRYSFPIPVTFKNSRVALSNVNMYYSWFNILASLNNNTYQYIFTDGSGSTTVTVTMPDGYYSISDMNTYLQSVMITNGHYLVDGSGNNVYYLELVENPTYYAIQLNCYPFPTALPGGFTNPNALTFPVTASTAQFVIQANAFQNIIGFTASTIPAVIQATTYSELSSFTPQVSTVQSLIVTSNLLNNRYSNPNTLLYSFSAGATSFGALINSSPNEFFFVPIQDGQYPYIEVTFLDQSYKRVNINDTNLIIQLLIETKIE